jgi:arsenate reductase-like glutaredoxin family protein
VDLVSDRPDDEALLALLLGRSGKLRAPTIRTGTRVLVGYNAEIMEDLLG